MTELSSEEAKKALEDRGEPTRKRDKVAKSIAGVFAKAKKVT